MKPMPGRRLPVRPVWLGFTINTLFYVAILLLLMRARITLRRFIRTRRRLCLTCGYPIGESAVCTECGSTVPGTPGVA
jgi:hypothetical protein